MAQIQSGKIPAWQDGDLCDAAGLNSMLDGALLNPEAISDQPLTTSISLNDKFLLFQSSTLTLKSITLSSILEVHFPPITVSQLISTAEGGINISSFNLLQLAGKTISLTAAGTDSGDITIASDHTVAIGGSQSTSAISLVAPITATAKLTLNTTGAMKIPVGTTAQRPSSTEVVVGDLRFNTTTGHTEVYNGTSWEAVGGSPFDATGGNLTVAPDNTSYSGTFTSTDGLKVVITSAGHSVRENETIDLSSTTALYNGRCQVFEVTTNTFTVYLNVAAIPTSGSCTFKIKRKYKTHFFTSSGNFIPASDGFVDVLVVGGGGGGWDITAGGGGAVIEVRDYPVSAGTTYYVTVGAGGNGGNHNFINPTAGGTSSFGNIIAGGGGIPHGTAGTGWWNGHSGSGNYGTIQYPETYANGSDIGKNGAAGAGGTYTSLTQINTANVSSTIRGGNGKYSDISGSIIGYGGGGWCIGNTSNVYPDGVSVFGEGIYLPYKDAPENRGGGGAGGVAYPYTGNGGNGGSGVVIIRYISWL